MLDWLLSGGSIFVVVVSEYVVIKLLGPVAISPIIVDVVLYVISCMSSYIIDDITVACVCNFIYTHAKSHIVMLVADVVTMSFPLY